MKLEKEVAVLCVLAGLVLAYVFSPLNSYAKMPVGELNRLCTGLVGVDALVTKTFFSQKSNLIGLLSNNGSTALVLLNDFPVAEGDRVTVYGRASRQGKQCWLFPNRVVWND